jgi:predicted nucleic acid-binding protein
MSYKQPYLDSSVFIAFFKGKEIDLKTNEDRAPIARRILRDAEDGKYSVITSTLTIAEVHKRKGWDKLTETQSVDILDYLENDFITFVEVDRAIADAAHRICREYGSRPNDGIHIASALRAKSEVLLVWDDKFEAIKHPQILIEKPRIYQGSIFDNMSVPSKPKLKAVKD